jgi:hypothetical protein
VSSGLLYFAFHTFRFRKRRGKVVRLMQIKGKMSFGELMMASILSERALRATLDTMAENGELYTFTDPVSGLEIWDFSMRGQSMQGRFRSRYR